MEDIDAEKLIEQMLADGADLKKLMAALSKLERDATFRLVTPRRLWNQIRSLPQFRTENRSTRGRPRRHNTKFVFDAILTKAYLGGLSWRGFEAAFGISGTTAFDQYMRWQKAGLFDELSKLKIRCHRGAHEVNWIWLKGFEAFRKNLQPDFDRGNNLAGKILYRLKYTTRGTPRKNRIRFSYNLFGPLNEYRLHNEKLLKSLSR